MENKVQLITYADRFGGTGIAAIHDFLLDRLPGVFGGIHLLPFYYPIDGEDAGYDPIDHTSTDDRIGHWADVKRLSETYDLTADMIVNHISAQSKEFTDVIERGEESPYFDLFITKEKVFGSQVAEEEINKIYRPRPGAPFTEVTIDNGKSYQFWTTFTSNQMDIDVLHEKGQDYLNTILSIFSKNGIKMIRLDAAGYAIKKAGTSCFMLPETYEFIVDLTQKANDLGMKVLVEIHGHFTLQQTLAKYVDFVYDFSLPPLVLHTLYQKSTKALKAWYAESPRNAITVLDTHDGIGIIDVGEHDGMPGLLNPKEIDLLVEGIHTASAGSSRSATGAAASNLDLYQVNCTFYEALGKNDQLYYIARTIQFFSPGIPQVYYAGFLAAENDMTLLAKTKVGRDINRPYFSFDQISMACEKLIVKQLISLMRFRNEHPSFQGEFFLKETSDEHLCIQWKHGEDWSSVSIDLASSSVDISYGDSNNTFKLTQ